MFEEIDWSKRYSNGRFLLKAGLITLGEPILAFIYLWSTSGLGFALLGGSLLALAPLFLITLGIIWKHQGAKGFITPNSSDADRLPNDRTAESEAEFWENIEKEFGNN